MIKIKFTLLFWCWISGADSLETIIHPGLPDRDACEAFGSILKIKIPDGDYACIAQTGDEKL